MQFRDLPKSWRGVGIDFLGGLEHNLLNQYSIRFSKDNIKDDVNFYIPKVKNNRFYLNGNEYIVWNRICKPICSIEYINNIQTLTVHNLLTRPDRSDNYDIKFYIEEDREVCEYKNHKYELDNLYLHDLLYSYWITNLDREDLNKFLGSENEENYITSEDLTNIFEILRNNKDYITNWKDILELRIIGLEDLLITTIMLSLPQMLRNFHKGELDNRIIERNIRAFMATEAPEIRLDMGETNISKHSQNHKIILPFNNYCEVDELLPDYSWYEYIDLLDSPQSIKVGSVAALHNNVIIENRKLRSA